MAISVMKAAVRPAVDADFSGIDVTRGFEEVYASNLVFEVAATQVLKVSLLKIEAITRGAARVGSDADVSTRRTRSWPNGNYF
jgi:hypothetical protein